MGKGYYWIEPVDQTLNDFQFYKARIVGDPEYDERHHRVILRTDKYFPVGSIFHVLKDPEMFPPLYFLVCMYIAIFEQKISVIWQIFKVNTMVIR